MRVFWIAILAMTGCGGTTVTSDPGASAPPDDGLYVRQSDFVIDITAPGSFQLVGVACDEGDVVVSDACNAGQGASLVQSAGDDYSWSCAFSASRDDVKVSVQVTCKKDAAPLCCFCAGGGWVRPENASASYWSIGSSCTQNGNGCSGDVTVCPDS